jgi:hypothetical protein
MGESANDDRLRRRNGADDYLRIYEEECTMRKNRLISLGFVALVVAAAITVAFANRGTAASTNTCAYTTPGPPPSEPNCFNVVVAPIYVTTTKEGLVTAKFSNIYGNASATHTVITLFLPENTSATAVSANATCSQTPDARTISCNFGNVPNGAMAKMMVRFTSSVPVGPSPIQVKGVLSYAEGNGTNGNDAFTDFGSFLSVTGDGSDKAGYCTTNPTRIVKNKLVPLVSTIGTTGQTATIESLAALAAGLCTPLAAGVEDHPAGAMCGQQLCRTQVSVVAFPATGTVTVLTPLSQLAVGTDASTFVLYELSIADGVTWIKLEPCPTQAPDTDSCISSQTNVTKNGVKYVQDVLTVVGLPPDGHYGG